MRIWWVRSSAAVSIRSASGPQVWGWVWRAEKLKTMRVCGGIAWEFGADGEWAGDVAGWFCDAEDGVEEAEGLELSGGLLWAEKT